MLKTKSKAKLWRIATNNIFFGGASAMVLAKRMKDRDGMTIVSQVYSVSAIQENPYLPKECGFCGCDFIPDDTDCGNFCSTDCVESYYG